MKNWIAAAVCLALTASPLTFAQDKAKAEEKKAAPAAQGTDKKGKQQERMAACNKEAGTKNLKGEERKKFMSSCLKG